jgi:hypothetical protein
MQQNPLSIVQAWQEAVNRQDEARLLERSAPTIEVVGPRGVAQGHDVLRQWLARAGLQLTTQRAFVGNSAVVLAQRGVWRSVESGEFQGEAQVASHFRVGDGQVTYYARYDRLDEALAAAALSAQDEVALGSDASPAH